jgi:hypothetical protein
MNVPFGFSLAQPFRAGFARPKRVLARFSGLLGGGFSPAQPVAEAQARKAVETACR